MLPAILTPAPLPPPPFATATAAANWYAKPWNAAAAAATRPASSSQPDTQHAPARDPVEARLYDQKCTAPAAGRADATSATLAARHEDRRHASSQAQNSTAGPPAVTVLSYSPAGEVPKAEWNMRREDTLLRGCGGCGPCGKAAVQCVDGETLKGMSADTRTYLCKLMAHNQGCT